MSPVLLFYDGLTAAYDLLFVFEGLAGMFFTEHVEVGFVDGLGGVGQTEAGRQGSADADKTAVAVFEVDAVGDMLQKGLEKILFGSAHWHGHSVACDLDNVTPIGGF